MMIAIKISSIIEKEDKKQKMEGYYKDLKNTPMWNNTEMYLPGELEYLKKKEKEGWRYTNTKENL